ncbi:hypothetical protein ABMA28_014426 [Loxostege sticticalis]|uniref:Sulfotransferase domain-containing protein n=1 Tax=Loxostege sticticalis TaxID=481309 RepID=A0ABD0TGR5_LOXSC
MSLRPDDIWVVTFPKSGTTWVQELVWMVANDFDYVKSSSIPLVDRFPFLEMSTIVNSDKAQAKMKELCGGNKKHMEIAEMLTKSVSLAEQLPSPRFIKTHLPLTLLPPSLLDTTKVVYVARDARDVAVSYFHHYKLMTFMGYYGDFKDYWASFVKGDVEDCPYFEHVKEFWEQRNHPNLLFLFYEDLLKDLPAGVRLVAQFLGKHPSEAQVAALSEYLTFDNFKKNKSVNFEVFKELGWSDKNMSFMRKGKAGDWRDYFDAEMAAQAQQWIDDNLRGTDLRFPEHDPK